MRRIAAISALFLAAALPQVATAQDDGVFFDPGGPSTKEYAVPDEHARGTGDPPSSGHTGGSGAAAPSARSEADPPVFGAGISPATGHRRAHGQAGARGGSRRPAGGRKESVVPVSTAATQTNSAAGFSWLALIAVAVALAGGGLAYLLGRRARGPMS